MPEKTDFPDEKIVAKHRTTPIKESLTSVPNYPTKLTKSKNERKMPKQPRRRRNLCQASHQPSVRHLQHHPSQELYLRRQTARLTARQTLKRTKSQHSWLVNHGSKHRRRSSQLRRRSRHSSKSSRSCPQRSQTQRNPTQRHDHCQAALLLVLQRKTLWGLVQSLRHSDRCTHSPMTKSSSDWRVESCWKVQNWTGSYDWAKTWVKLYYSSVYLLL